MSYSIKLLAEQFNFLERLHLSKTSEDRENFLGAVYELQQDHEQSTADHENDKEIEGFALDFFENIFPSRVGHVRKV